MPRQQVLGGLVIGLFSQGGVHLHATGEFVGIRRTF